MLFARLMNQSFNMSSDFQILYRLPIMYISVICGKISKIYYMQKHFQCVCSTAIIRTGSIEKQLDQSFGSQMTSGQLL